MQYKIDAIHVLHVKKRVTVCNCFVNEMSIKINEEITTAIKAKTMDTGAIKV
jgi:hypothetical protein